MRGSSNGSAKVMLSRQAMSKHFRRDSGDGHKRAAQNRAERFVNSIMKNTIAIEPIPNSTDMGVLEFVVNLETGIQPRVVLRNITEGFWQACIDLVDMPDKRNRVCVAGTAGVGKSITISVLIRMLLNKGASPLHLRTPSIGESQKFPRCTVMSWATSITFRFGN